MPLETIGNFDIIEAIGRNSLGTIYHGLDPELQRPAAILVLRRELTADADGVERFRLAAQAAAALIHPGIVTIYGVGEQDGSPYVAGELLGGTDLARAGHLDRGAICRVILRVAEGLGFAHARGVVHRDLKPANIWLVDADVVKIVDFGLVSALGPAARGQQAGPGYLAPEHHRGETATDACSDIFALGAILYERLAGRHPFAPPAAGGVATDPLAPSGLLAGQPLLERVVRRCLEGDPARRYSSCEEFIADFKVAVNAASGPTAMSPAAKPGHADAVDANPLDDPLGVASHPGATAPTSAGERDDLFAPATDAARIAAAAEPVTSIKATMPTAPATPIVNHDDWGADGTADESEHDLAPDDAAGSAAIDATTPFDSDDDAIADPPASPFWPAALVAILLAAAIGAGAYILQDRAVVVPREPTAAADHPASTPAVRTTPRATPTTEPAATDVTEPSTQKDEPGGPTDTPDDPGDGTAVTDAPRTDEAGGRSPVEPDATTGAAAAEVQALLAAGDALAARNDWTQPPGACALDKYMEAIRLDGSSAAAKHSIASVFDFFLRRGNELAAAGDPSAARIRYNRARAVLDRECVEAGLADLAERRADLEAALERLPSGPQPGDAASSVHR